MPDSRIRRFCTRRLCTCLSFCHSLRESASSFTLATIPAPLPGAATP